MARVPRLRDLIVRVLPAAIVLVLAAAPAGAPQSATTAGSGTELGVIEGHIHDDQGDPIAGVVVRALRSRLLAGRRLLEANSGSPAPSAATDAAGAYRLSVQPGRYAVGVAAAVFPGGRAGPGAAVIGHPTAFFPGSPTASGAALLTLAAGGTESGIDFALSRAPFVRVSGAMAGADAVPNLAVRLERDELGDVRTDLDVRTATTGPDGQFAFDGVPPGRYHLRVVKLSIAPGQPIFRFSTDSLYFRSDGALPPRTPFPAASEAPALWADVTVDVPDDGKNVADLPVWLQPGLRVSGKVVFQSTGAAPKPAPDPAQSLQSVGIALIAIDDPGRDTPPGRVEADGTFLLPSVPPGRYVLLDRLIREGWTAKTVNIDGRDMQGRVLNITSVLQGVAITMTDARASALSGIVGGADGAPAPDASVYVFPRDRQRWAEFFDSSFLSPWFRETRPDTAGKYSLTAVPPGDYFVAAIAGPTLELWGEPETFAALVGSAVPVHLGLADVRRLDLVARLR